jgi:hypothetical protein
MSARTGVSSEQRTSDSAAFEPARDAAPGKRTLLGDDAAPVQRKASGEAQSGGALDRALDRAGDWTLGDGMLSAMGLGGASGASGASSGGPVQRKAAGTSSHAVQANGGELTGPDITAAADRGVAGASSPLPYFDQIQQSFGRHDVSGIRAKIGGEAETSAKEIGAEAYATGDRVAFAKAPDLFTAAHEAAHVVQQAGGEVQLKDGVGQVGDLYEQHADAVANAVVAGKSAEGLLDGFASSSSSSAAAGTQKKAVQRVASDYKSNVQIKAMDLSGFDRYAHAQADWATSTTLGADKEDLRLLLAFARKSDGLVLGACGDFTVQSLFLLAIGQGTNNDAKLTAYSRAASPGKNAGTIAIESPAADATEAIAWGDALLKLEAGIHGLILKRVIPQNGSYEGLKALVDDGAVDDFIAYYKGAKPLLDAANGREIRSYLAFRGEGGQGKYAGYKGSLPEIRNYHRFTVGQLDALAANRVKAQTNKVQVAPLPITVVLQTAFDHNGAFHRDPFMTAVINRVTHITLFAEGKDSLGAFGTELTKFSAWGKDDKVDEVMVAGHGDAKLMELAGDKGVGKAGGNTIYGIAKMEEVTVDKNDKTGSLVPTDDLIKTIKAVLRDDPSARVVLNACLTASNSVEGVVFDPDPDKAAKQIRDAIAADPSLATAMKTKLGAHQGQVRGANASFGQVSLLDGGGNIDIISGSDPKLTAPKLEYAEGGTEPTGVLRATLEAWGTDRDATIKALKRRIAANGADTGWRERVICSVMRLIVASPDDASLISTMVGTAGALSHLTARADCRVSALKGKVPTAHMDAIFTDLTGAALWTDASFEHVPAVVFQVWVDKNNGKIGDFLTFLNTSSFTTQNAAALFDLVHLLPLAASLMPAPGAPATPPKGPFLIALLYLVKDGSAAPAKAKEYIKTVVGVGKQDFPGTCGVDDILKGASTQSVLEAADVIKKASAPPIVPMGVLAPVGPTPNLDPTHSGNNTIAVDSTTSKCATYGLTATNAYMLPTGNKIGSIPSGTSLNVVGKTKGMKKGVFSDSPNTDFFAVEYTIGTAQTVFVAVADVNVT